MAGFGMNSALQWFVGAEDFAVVEDAEVALLVEEGEEFGRFGAGRDGDGEGDEDGLGRRGFPWPMLAADSGESGWMVSPVWGSWAVARRGKRSLR